MKIFKKFLSYTRPEEILFLVFLISALILAIPLGREYMISMSFIPETIARSFVTVWFLCAIIVVFCFTAVNFFIQRHKGSGSCNKRGAIRDNLQFAGEGFKELFKITRDFSSFVVCIGIYSVLLIIIPLVNSGEADSFLAMLDYLCFGINPFIWLQQFSSPVLTNILNFCYWSYYVSSPLLAAALYVYGKKKIFRDLMLALVISALAAFIGYMIFPTVGPQYVLKHLYAINTPTALITVPVPNFFKVSFLTPRDCFPSLHTAWAVITLYYCYRWNKKLAIFYLPVATGLVIATIYFAYHYFADIPAGIVTAVIAVFLAEKLNAAWYRNIKDLSK